VLDVKIENILPITQVKNELEKLVDKVKNSDELIVVASNGSPGAILIGIHNLEVLTGTSHEELMPEVEPTEEEATEEPEEEEETAPAPIDYLKLRDQVLQEATQLPPEDEELPAQSVEDEALGKIDRFAGDTAATIEAQKAPEQTDQSVSEPAGEELTTTQTAGQTQTNPQFSYSPSSDAGTNQQVATPTDQGRDAMPSVNAMNPDEDELTVDASPINSLLPPDNEQSSAIAKDETPLTVPSTTEDMPAPTASPVYNTPSSTPAQPQVSNSPLPSSAPQNNQGQAANPPVIYQ